MKKRIQLPKSVFPRIGEKTMLLSVMLLSCFALSCTAAADEDISIQQKKREAIARTIALQQTVDSIVVYKSRREMRVYHGKKYLKTYIISLGTAPAGRKRMQGDYKTPEGKYTISDKNPNSIYHKNLAISYPNNEDREYARLHGLTTGGDVKIHGLPNQPRYKPEAYLYSDWTWGCIAVSNAEIDELYRYVTMGAVICILP